MRKLLKHFLIILLTIGISNLYSAEKISDIKVEGLQRVDPGLIFNSIPFEINDDIDSVDFSRTIKLIYKTGQFKDVTI